MKKLIFIIILLGVCSAYTQTDEKETLKQINQNVISSYRNQKFDDALKFAQQAVDLSGKIYGNDSRETAVAYTNIGVIYREKNKLKESIENLQRASDIFQKVPTLQGKELIAAYETLAFSQFLDGKKKEAEANYLKAVEIAENKFGKESRESFSPTLNTANFYERINDNDKADDFYLKSFTLAIKNFGKESKELESVSIYRGYYLSGNSWNDDKKVIEFNKKKAKIFGFDEMGKPISLIIPSYSSEAKSKGIKGRIVVKVWVDENGNVTNSKAVFGEMFFATAAEEASRKSKFKPTVINGKTIPFTDFIIYKFVY